MTTRLFNGKPPPKTIEQLVADAKKKRVNRVYYSNKFELCDIRELGIIQCNKKSRYDEVSLDGSRNESIEFYGFDRKGSYFNLSTTILSLYDKDCPVIESKWRLAKVSFSYVNIESDCKYTYDCEQLIDYESKRRHSAAHETRNIYKIGSLSIETVFPFSLTRILFNGLLTNASKGAVDELVSAKFTISTHPTCDKFDYKYRFNTNYLSERLSEQIRLDSNSCRTEQLLPEILEDRIDQTMMFQGHLELLGTESVERFIMWGAKLKRFIDPRDELSGETRAIKRENLFIWNECGHWIHLTRPLLRPTLVYGLINNCYEYASPLYGAKYIPPERAGEQKPDVGSASGFGQLDAFTSLRPGCKLILKGYKKKDFELEVKEINRCGLMRIVLNTFEGWAMIGNERVGNLGQELRVAQRNLWALSIEPKEERKLSMFTNLASERLLGGKGNSLIELNKFVKTGSLIQDTSRLSVPKGIVVTCIAYQLWLKSNPIILNSIDELDATRRALLARSVNLNPMSDDYLSLVQTQQILKEQCLKTSVALNSCPLPATLKEHLSSILLQQFTEEELALGPDDGTSAKLFAVRSSAVGEDSLETSAAGQMRTILDARGFEAICRSIVDCWSSQFEMEAVTYKSQNGLPLNLPMAVVVQELIGCHAAGVAATCDPLTGNKEQVEILANRGLGEAVVSGGKADTIRVSLRSLGWNTQTECSIRPISLKNAKDHIVKVAPNTGDTNTCCLTDPQIVDLANLLIKLRQVYHVNKNREIEWGITIEESPPSSSSSSSSDDESEKAVKQKFHIHLLQSRPLTHLYKLSSREIDHELDCGFSSPLDIVSRANLGEVFPGVLCPLTSTYFLTLSPNVSPDKPFESDHTLRSFIATSFAHYGQLLCMVLTHSDLISKFVLGKKDDDLIMKFMVGTTPNDPYLKNLERIDDLNKEKVHPLSLIRRENLFKTFSYDVGLIQMRIRLHKRSMAKTCLEDDLESIDTLRGKLEEFASLIGGDEQQKSAHKRLACWPFGIICDPIGVEVRSSAVKLFDRICQSSHVLVNCWLDHMIATRLSMVLNMICFKILEKQAVYADLNESFSEILNDFSVLVRGGPKTESGDISNLLEELIVALDEEGKLEEAKEMKAKELYKLLIQQQGSSRSSKLYAKFMAKNGHRAFKEFNFATASWADDPSYIIKSLAARLKQQQSINSVKESLQIKKIAQERKLQTEMDAILAKVVENRALLMSYALPRARNAIARREKTKSQMILAIDKFRRAFRHLGALLCLEGRLPSAELIFQLSIEEVDRVVHGETGELAGILYKARRRQQRARVMDLTTYPRPVLDFDDMVETIRGFSEGSGLSNSVATTMGATTTAQEEANMVRGMTSCAGCVTGRACVVSSPDDMDQIQPNDILITYSIDTSWSVYFFTLAGIVTEVGGIVSHGAVVAREYGIPTLCTALGACSKFKTGQLVTLNANQGTCYLASEANGQGGANGEGISGHSKLVNKSKLETVDASS